MEWGSSWRGKRQIGQIQNGYCRNATNRIDATGFLVASVMFRAMLARAAVDELYLAAISIPMFSAWFR